MLGQGNKLVAVSLIAVMAVGSVVMWLGVPFGWIYVVSQSVESSQPAMGPYVLLLVGIPSAHPWLDLSVLALAAVVGIAAASGLLRRLVR